MESPFYTIFTPPSSIIVGRQVAICDADVADPALTGTADPTYNPLQVTPSCTLYRIIYL